LSKNISDIIRNIPDNTIFIEDPYFGIINNKNVLTNDPYQLGIIIKKGVQINGFYKKFDDGTINYVVKSNLIKLFPNLNLEERGFKKIYTSTTWITHGYWEIWGKN